MIKSPAPRKDTNVKKEWNYIHSKCQRWMGLEQLQYINAAYCKLGT